MADDERRTFLFKEIDLVQDIIKRMANNSFLIKGWTITLVVATLLFKGKHNQIFISFIPLVCFWFLDAYFLWQERLYIRLYSWIIANRLTSEEFLLDMRPHRFKKEEDSKVKIMFSLSLLFFYGSIAIVILLYPYVNGFNCKGGF